MWHVDNLNDTDILLAFLQRDRAYAAYAIGDLEPTLAGACTWFGAWQGTALRTLALIYAGLQPPVLFTMGATAGLRAIVAAAALPAAVMIASQPQHAPTLQARYAFDRLSSMWRMTVRPADFRPVVTAATQRLTPDATPALQALYALGGEHAPDSFRPAQVAEGVFYGIFMEDGLAAAGGTHLVARQRGVAAVGNIYTHPAYRGRGLATSITSAISTELLTDGLAVVLNVNEDNAPALAVYQKLGYRCVRRFVEGVGRSIENK